MIQDYFVILSEKLNLWVEIYHITVDKAYIEQTNKINLRNNCCIHASL